MEDGGNIQTANGCLMVYNLSVFCICVNSTGHYLRGEFLDGILQRRLGSLRALGTKEDIKIVGICILEIHLSYFMNARLIHYSGFHRHPVMGSRRVNTQFDGMPDPTDPNTGPIG